MSRGLAAGILAGGRARRLGGIDKPRIAIDGRTIFARQLDVLAPRVDEVLVAIAPGAAPLAVPPRWHDRVRFVVDDVADAG
ncbi:MAG: NTP transferase domain-containing protein, partial [Myxococcales bacterium]|nr:NTP transferase domain-containing protein [Myxococcales bacterium]